MNLTLEEFCLGRLRDSVADFRELVRFWKQLQDGLKGLGNVNFRAAMCEFGVLCQKSL